jgi:hypothetical protein
MPGLLLADERIFDVFPDNPDFPNADGVSNLSSSLRIASETGKPHAMKVQRYDVRDLSGNFVVKYWRPLNTPMFDENDRLIYVVPHVRTLRRRCSALPLAR